MRKHELIEENRRLEEMFETSAIATSFCLSFIHRRFKDQLSNGEKAVFVLITILNLVDLLYLIGLDLAKIKNRRGTHDRNNDAFPPRRISKRQL